MSEEKLPEYGRIWDRGQMKDYKLCSYCGQVTVRRKKWKNDSVWQSIKYCGDKCRNRAKSEPETGAQDEHQGHVRKGKRKSKKNSELEAEE
jgi:hypothetical protein